MPIDNSIWLQATVDESLYSKLIKEKSQIISTVLAQSFCQYDDSLKFLNVKLSKCIRPSTIHNIIEASEHIRECVNSNGTIVLATDHDNDGIAGAAVLYETLTKLLKVQHVHLVMGNRLQLRGLNDDIIRRIIDIKPSLVITADQGTNDVRSLQTLSDHDIKVIVTDHHAFTTQLPDDSNVVVVNSCKADVDLPIAGCTVAWLLMLQVLITMQVKDRDFIVELLDFVAVATLSDRVPMNHWLNRLIVTEGLKVMNRKHKPCWFVLAKEVEFYSRCHEVFNSLMLPFSVLPLLSASDRMADPLMTFKLLTTTDVDQAAILLRKIKSYNRSRKRRQNSMYTLYKKQLYRSYIKETECFFHSDNYVGVIGIIAAKMLSSCRLACAFASSNDQLVGSLRSDHYSVIQVLQDIDKSHPSLLLRYGGHDGAGGCSIANDQLDLFDKALSKSVASLKVKIRPQLYFNLLEKDSDINEYCHALEALEPFGSSFNVPLLQGTCRILHVKRSTDSIFTGTVVTSNNYKVDVIAFSPNCHIAVGLYMKVLYYIEKAQARLFLKHIKPIP